MGESVVATIPLDALELENSDTITSLEAFSAQGTYFGGPRSILDEVGVKR